MNDPRIGERVELFKGTDGQWYFRRVAANNEPVAGSDGEGYHNFGDAEAESSKIFPDIPAFVQHDDGTWSKWVSNSDD